MSLSQHLVEFRKSLFADLDEAFLKASNTLLNNMVTEMVIQNNKNYGEILRRLEQLEQQSQTKPVMLTIPELFGTKTNLYDVVPESLSHEDVDEEDDAQTMETDSISGEVVEEDNKMVHEEEEEEEAEAEVVDDDTQPPEEDEGEAYDADEDDTGDSAAGEDEDADADADAEEALQELEVDGETYYYDSAGNVYKADENGEVGDPVGTYDESSGEFELFEAATETLEPFTYKGKTYLKDSQDNVYLEDGSETDFHLVGGKMARKV